MKCWPINHKASRWIELICFPIIIKVNNIMFCFYIEIEAKATNIYDKWSLFQMFEHLFICTLLRDHWLHILYTNPQVKANPGNYWQVIYKTPITFPKEEIWIWICSKLEIQKQKIEEKGNTKRNIFKPLSSLVLISLISLLFSYFTFDSVF